MAKHFAGRRHYGWIAAGGVALAVLVAGGAVLALRTPGSASATARTAAAHSKVAPSTTTTAPPVPLTVALSGAATGVDGASPIVLTTSTPTGVLDGSPTISPAVPGSWSDAPGQLVFTPTDALAPSTTYTITVPAGLRSGPAEVLSPAHLTLTTVSGSTLRLQQLLAQLGYLPLSWTQTPGTPAVTPGKAAFDPPSGAFAWTWASPPASLQAAWSPGQYTVMTKGAVMAFEADHRLATDGVAGPEVWSTLLATTASAQPVHNTHGYTYALAVKSTPETLTVYHDGTVISQTGANTGIPQAPTADGTFPVYERLANQVMKGTNPDGSKYADPVSWVAYFNGGDAIHYIGRSYYGSPQSLGCVEVSYATGQHVWPYLTIGSLVTVAE